MWALGRTAGWLGAASGAAETLAAWIAAFGDPRIRASAHAVAASWEPGAMGADADDPATALATWSVLADPLRLDRARHVARLRGTAPPQGDQALRGWTRAAFESGLDASAVAVALGARAARAGTLWRHADWRGGQPALLPFVDWPEVPQVDADAWAETALGRGPVVALVGPAAAGKTTLARHLAARFGARVVHADAHNWPGEGFRYDIVNGLRVALVDGPGLCDDAALLRAIDGPGRVVVEGCFVGLDPRVAARLAGTLRVRRDDDERLTARFLRDRDRPLDVVTDVCAKAFGEDADAIAAIGVDGAAIHAL
jgi:hypothetical protein